ncbi:hypothetical protein J6590_073404 [Homalodisca vitripennis]|nr:hypothetical protein J6590_073404 [Homalodisca vitripennis]
MRNRYREPRPHRVHREYRDPAGPMYDTATGECGIKIDSDVTTSNKNEKRRHEYPRQRLYNTREQRCERPQPDHITSESTDDGISNAEKKVRDFVEQPKPTLHNTKYLNSFNCLSALPVRKFVAQLKSQA